ncbi:hypothetical protein D3C84_579340 [compost metagenome]
MGRDCSEMRKLAPRRKNMPARVMMKAGIFRVSMSQPIRAPKPAPSTSTRGMASSGLTPRSPMSLASSTPVKAMTAPTERSMPPERMTKVMPTATMPRKALSVSMLQMMRVDMKAGKEARQSR